MSSQVFERQSGPGPKGPNLLKCAPLGHLCHDACTNCAAAFADGKANTFFNADHFAQIKFDLGLIAGAHQTGFGLDGNHAGDVSRSEVELRLIAGSKRGMTSAFFSGIEPDRAERPHA